MKNKYINKHNIISFCLIVLSSLVMAIVTKDLVKPASLLTGGFMGIAIFIEMLGKLIGINIPTSVGLLLLNLPVVIFITKAISKRFVFFSVCQIILTSFFLSVVPKHLFFSNVMLNVIFGGFLNGMAIVVALHAGGSSGGTDFIALYFSNKNGKEIWMEVFAFNAAMLVAFGYIFGFEHAGYSILYQFISTKTISTFHSRYKRVTLHIFTHKKEEVLKSYLKHFHHGITVLDGVGGYSKQEISFMIAIISSYEVNDLIRRLRRVDPQIIINVTNSDNYVGKFYTKPIE